MAYGLAVAANAVTVAIGPLASNQEPDGAAAPTDLTAFMRRSEGVGKSEIGLGMNNQGGAVALNKRVSGGPNRAARLIEMIGVTHVAPAC
ncbi:MAG: hypothetical protein ACT4QA_07060 [Panacagrimonas sp.]